MAARTATNVALHNLGSLNLTIAYFSDLDSADIWNSSIQNIVTCWANKRDTAANGSGAGVGVGWTTANGTLSFHCEASTQADVFVLSGFRNQL